MADKKPVAEVAVAKKATVTLSPAERFTQKVTSLMVAKASSSAEMSEFQKRLMQNYFVATDNMLASAEQRRLAKNENYRDKVPVIWQNIDMDALAVDVDHYSRLGLDPCLKNHLHIIPYKNNKTGKYDINFMPGYVGLELTTKKYALDVPLDVTVELVKETDVFKVYKKSASNLIENYDFDITNPFGRGATIGGFAYVQYADTTKNQLIVLTLEDIEKRKGSGSGNAEFWGGEKDKWENGKKNGKEQIDGWFDEMCLKTVKRCVFGGNYIPLDPQKIDETYNYIKSRQADYSKAQAELEIDENANTGDKIEVDFSIVEPTSNPAISPIVDEETGEVISTECNNTTVGEKE